MRRNYIFLAIAFMTLFLSFYSNFFELVPQSHFEEFDSYDKGFVYGRIMNAETNGFFSDACFPGLMMELDSVMAVKEYDPDSAHVLSVKAMSDQKSMYLGQMEQAPQFGPYLTQPCPMASVYAAINLALTTTSPETKLNIYDFINAFLNALVFLLLFWWILKEYGLLPASVTLVSLLISCWFISFCGNLWWIAGSFYIPVFGMFLLLRKNLPEKKILFYLFLLFTVKTVFTGFEFITCAFLSVFIPIIYYYYYRRKTFKEFFIFSLKAALMCFLAVLVVAVILIIQHKVYHGSFSAGFEWLMNAYERRSSDPADSLGLFKNLMYIFLTYYWFRDGFDVFGFQVPFTFIILTVFINLIVLYRITRKRKDSRKYKALVLATALSYIPSVSWYVVFRNHALEHQHIDSICWYFPFLILGFLSIGVTIRLLYNRWERKEF